MFVSLSSLWPFINGFWIEVVVDIHQRKILCQNNWCYMFHGDSLSNKRISTLNMEILGDATMPNSYSKKFDSLKCLLGKNALNMTYLGVMTCQRRCVKKNRKGNKDSRIWDGPKINRYEFIITKLRFAFVNYFFIYYFLLFVFFSVAIDAAKRGDLQKVNTPNISRVWAEVMIAFKPWKGAPFFIKCRSCKWLY